MELEHAVQLVNHPFISQSTPSIWADLGAGAGLFTTALASKLAPGSKIYAVDKSVKLSNAQKDSQVQIENIKADFTSEKMNIGNLDGILMANSLHYVPNKMEVLTSLRSLFRHGGCFVIIEYDMSTANAWVPYPITFQALQVLFSNLGYRSIEKIHVHPSKYQRASIYSAVVK
ncbi:MAG: class I SAM-dependent methyltransferase [Flavitalea sp.]